VFNFSGSEIVFLLLLALIVLGPEKLPDAVRKFGKTYAEFKKVTTGFQTELKAALDEPMREMKETADALRKAATFDVDIDPKAMLRGGTNDATTAQPSTATPPATTGGATTDTTPTGDPPRPAGPDFTSASPPTRTVADNEPPLVGGSNGTTRRASAAPTSTAGTSAAGTSADNTSAAGSSAADTSADRTSSADTSTPVHTPASSATGTRAEDGAESA
jgi:sec-independent protein translocase protein TatB